MNMFTASQKQNKEELVKIGNHQREAMQGYGVYMVAIGGAVGFVALIFLLSQLFSWII